MTSVIPFPSIAPILIQVGPFAIRRYAFPYLVGLPVGWRHVRWLARPPPEAVSEVDTVRARVRRNEA